MAYSTDASVYQEKPLAIALPKTIYDIKLLIHFACEGSRYESFTKKANTATDKVFRLGKAIIRGDNIIVTAPKETPFPIKAIRYAFTNFPITNIQNSAGLPMEPFRADNWEN